MGGNLVVGCLTMIVCLAVQCVVVGFLFEALVRLDKKQILRASLFWVSFLLIVVMLVMIAGNLLQIGVWAGLFVVVGEFHDFTTAFDHSIVNFTTLGYGDVVMSTRRRLLGGLEAANGMLMLGLTTGFLFALFNELMRRRIREERGPDASRSH